jgi:hypothetical protein
MGGSNAIGAIEEKHGMRSCKLLAPEDRQAQEGEQAGGDLQRGAISAFRSVQLHHGRCSAVDGGYLLKGRHAKQKIGKIR